MKNIEIIKEFDQMVEKKFNDGISEYIEHLKQTRGIDDEDIMFFVGKNYDKYHPYELEDMSGQEVMRLIELCNDSEPTLSMLQQYKDNTDISIAEKVKFVLDMFNVTDENSLNQLINAIIDVRNGIEAVADDCRKDENAGKCQCCAKNEQNENTEKPDNTLGCGDSQKTDKLENKGNAKFTYSYYDSDTMEKPVEKTIEFDLDKNSDIDTEEIINQYEKAERLFRDIAEAFVGSAVWLNKL